MDSLYHNLFENKLLFSCPHSDIFLSVQQQYVYQMKKFKKIINKKEIAVSYGDLFFNSINSGYFLLHIRSQF